MELRERIAVTIYHAASQWDDHPWDALAGHIQALYIGQSDAVMLELGLRIERGQRSKPEGPLWGSNNRYTVYRYVTDWKADDE